MSAAMNMSDFQNAGFDPRAWINRELANVKPDSLETTVSTLSLKLQVLGNEVNTCFEDHIAQSLAKLPMYACCSVSVVFKHTHTHTHTHTQVPR